MNARRCSRREAGSRQSLCLLYRLNGSDLAFEVAEGIENQLAFFGPSLLELDEVLLHLVLRLVDLVQGRLDAALDFLQLGLQVQDDGLVLDVDVILEFRLRLVDLLHDHVLAVPELRHGHNVKPVVVHAHTDLFVKLPVDLPAVLGLGVRRGGDLHDCPVKLTDGDAVRHDLFSKTFQKRLRRGSFRLHLAHNHTPRITPQLLICYCGPAATRHRRDS